jgi:hypothetical protein
VAKLDHDQRRAGPEARDADDRVDRLGGQAGQHEPVTRARSRLLGVHMQVAERLGRDHLDRVRDRPQRPQRGEQVVRLSDGAEVDGVDHHEGLAAQVGGQIGGRREVHQPGGGGELLRQTGLGELAPSLQHLGGRLGGPPQQPGVDLGDRKQPQLDRGDHAEAAAAAA